MASSDCVTQSCPRPPLPCRSGTNQQLFSCKPSVYLKTLACFSLIFWCSCLLPKWRTLVVGMPGQVCSRKMKPGSLGSQDPSPETRMPTALPCCVHTAGRQPIIASHSATCSRCSLGHISFNHMDNDRSQDFYRGRWHPHFCSLSYSYEERAGSQRNGPVDGYLSGNMLTTLLCLFPIHKPFSCLHPEVTVSAQHPFAFLP